MKFLTFFYFFLILMVTTSVRADDVNNASQLVNVKEWHLGVTLGYGQLQQPVANRENIALFLVPDIRYYTEKFSIENLNVSYALFEQPNLVIELVGKQNFDGIYFPGKYRGAYAAFAASGSFVRVPSAAGKNSTDNMAVEVIVPQHKSMSYMAGAEIRLYGKLDYYLTAVYDVSNVHNGYELDLSVHYQYEFNEINNNLEAGLIHKSDNMGNYYYGVDYAQFSQNNHTVSSTNSWYLQYTAAYALSKNWFVLGVVKQQWLDSDIGRSPVIAKSNILSYFFGIKYMY